jgi:glycosyltransferase involved in cell wall biosynthesis
MTTAAAPLVSVLMPVYNGAKYLRESIQSILGQTFGDFELVIVDDGSTDDTPSVIQEFSRKDARVRAHRQNNQGHVGALITGLEKVRGTYVARMDGDDVSLPARLAAQVSYLESHPDVGVLGTAATVIDADGSPVVPVRFPTQHWVIRWALCFSSAIIHPSAMMRRSVLQKAGGYDHAMKHAEDYDLWRRLSLVTRLANLEDVLLLLRKHEKNVSASNAGEELRFSLQVANRVVADLLGESVPAGLVARAWEQRARTSADAIAVAQLVYRLYNALAENDEVSDVEMRIIRRDAARRVYERIRPRTGHTNVRNLLRAFYLDPSLLMDPVSVAWGRLRRRYQR